MPDPVVGESFTAAMRGRAVGRIVAVVVGEHLTGEIMGAMMSYVLVAAGSGTRLLLKVVMRRGRVIAPLVSCGDLIMSRRQLLNFAALTEASSPSSSDG